MSANKEDIEEYCKIAMEMMRSSALNEFENITMKYSAYFSTIPEESKLSITQIDSDRFKSFLTDFRKIYAENERTNFYKIIGVLIKKAKCDREKDILKRVHADYGETLKTPPRKMMLKTVSASEAFSSDDIIRIIFYGKIFHRVEPYKRIYDEMEETLMLSMAIFALQIVIVDLSNIIIGLGDYIQENKLASLF